MKVLIGTKNVGKIEGARQALEKYYDNIEIEGIAVSSEVSEQPLNDEIYNGAKNRVDNLIRYASENGIDATYFLGIESGITNLLGKWVITSIAVIKDKNGFESWGTSASYPVPERYVSAILKTDLGKVIDEIFKQRDSKVGKGGIGFLTKNEITRIDLTRDAFIMALTQFINEDVWSDKSNNI